MQQSVNVNLTVLVDGEKDLPFVSKLLNTITSYNVDNLKVDVGDTSFKEDKPVKEETDEEVEELINEAKETAKEAVEKATKEDSVTTEQYIDKIKAWISEDKNTRPAIVKSTMLKNFNKSKLPELTLEEVRDLLDALEKLEV